MWANCERKPTFTAHSSHHTLPAHPLPLLGDFLPPAWPAKPPALQKWGLGWIIKISVWTSHKTRRKSTIPQIKAEQWMRNEHRVRSCLHRCIERFIKVIYSHSVILRFKSALIKPCYNTGHRTCVVPAASWPNIFGEITPTWIIPPPQSHPPSLAAVPNTPEGILECSSSCRAASPWPGRHLHPSQPWCAVTSPSSPAPSGNHSWRGISSHTLATERGSASPAPPHYLS